MATVAHHVVRQTTGAGRPRAILTLIHGVGDSYTAWDEVVAHLPDGLDVIRYDLRGHGASDKPPGPYTLEDFVSDHLDVLRGQGVQGTHLAGFSLGGMIAQAIALRAPQVVQRLVVMGSVAGRTDAERERVLERLRIVESGGPEATAHVSANRWFSDEFAAAHPDVVEAQLRRLAANDPAAYRAAYRVLATNDLIEEVSAIVAPTLVMTGEFDVGSPPHMSHSLAERIPGARVEILAGQRHSILRERPEVVAAAIGAFVTEGVAASGMTHAADVQTRPDAEWRRSA
jgi:pimeloyl-ACP methyl ester carboxylesterase